MPWFKIDDGFHGHPKVVELSLPAVGLWTLCGSWCAKYLTDGFVPEKTVTRLGGDVEHAAELVSADLWDEAIGGGYWFRDWADYQPLKVDVEAERAAAQERMRAVRAKKKGVRPNNSRTDDERSPEQSENFGRSSEDVRVTPSQSHPSTDQTPKGVNAQKRGTRISDEFTVSAEMVAWARVNAPLVNGQLSTQKFVNHFMAKTGRDATKLDWVRTWKNWMLSDQEKAELRAKLTPEQRARQTLTLATDIELKEIGA